MGTWGDATWASASHYCLPCRRMAPPGGRILGARRAASAARRSPVPGAAAGVVAAKTLAPPPAHGRDALGRSDRNDRGGGKCGEPRAALRLRLCALFSRVDVFADFFAPSRHAARRRQARQASRRRSRSRPWSCSPPAFCWASSAPRLCACQMGSRTCFRAS